MRYNAESADITISAIEYKIFGYGSSILTSNVKKLS
jgi:hypothetical protein